VNAKIWIVSELYYPEETSTGYLLTGIAEGLAKHFQVCVLCSQPTYSKRGLRSPHTERYNGVSIRRCFGTTFNKDILPSRLMNMATISMSVFINALFRIGKLESVLVVTNPPFLPFLVYLACRLKGAKCLLLIHDVYPEVMIAAGMIRRTSFVAGVLAWLNKCLYRGADRIIVLGRDMAEVTERKLGAPDSKIVIIPNWADVTMVSPCPRGENVMLKELKLQRKFVMQYAGNMGRTHGLEILAQAAQKLAEQKDVHFVFIGSGHKIKWLETKAAEAKLTNVTFVGSRPRNNQNNFLNACDIAIVSFVSGMAGISVPSRMYNIMAAGKPILAVADTNSELAMVIAEEEIGWVVVPGDIDGLVRVIDEARVNPELLREMGKRARKAAEEKYNLNRVIDMYRGLFASL
jgi:glycosyltransferase involved in cell wall biosynthesis